MLRTEAEKAKTFRKTGIGGQNFPDDKCMFLWVHNKLKHCIYYICKTIMHCMFAFDPKQNLLSQRLACMIWMPQTMNTIVYLTLRSYKKRLRLCIYHLIRVGLAFSSVEMSPASAAKPAVQGSPEEMVGPCNHRHIPVYVHLPWKCYLCSVRVRLPDCLKSLQTATKSCRLSGNLPECQEIYHIFKKYSALSTNLSYCPNFLQTVRSSFKLSQNIPNCPRDFPDRTKIFQTVQKFSRLSWNLPDYPEVFNTVWKSSRPPWYSRLSGNLLDCPE